MPSGQRPVAPLAPSARVRAVRGVPNCGPHAAIRRFIAQESALAAISNLFYAKRLSLPAPDVSHGNDGCLQHLIGGLNASPSIGPLRETGRG
jgi:hypothetical protein